MLRPYLAAAAQPGSGSEEEEKEEEERLDRVNCDGADSERSQGFFLVDWGFGVSRALQVLVADWLELASVVLWQAQAKIRWYRPCYNAALCCCRTGKGKT